MRYLAALVTASCLLAGAWSETATASNQWIGYQGLLTDGGSNPVPDGPHDLILSIWTDSVGGSMLHSELVTVTTTKGLFTTALGRGASPLPDIFTNQPLYLETQVSGQAALSPRVGIGTATAAMSSSSLHGEATSGSARARGIIAVKSPSGSGSTSRLDADSDGDGVPDYVVRDSVTLSSASRVLERDSDDDGLPDQSISEIMVPGVSSVAIKTKGTGADKDRIIGTTYPDSAIWVVGRDSDGDGVDDRSITQSVTPGTSSVAINTKGTGADKNRIASTTYPDSAVHVVLIDDNGDGTNDESVSLKVIPGTSSVAIKTKGTGADANRVVTSTSTGSAGQTIGHDSDGDDIDDDGISSLVVPGQCSVAINTKGTGADKNRVISTTTPGSAGQTIGHDSDGDDIDDDGISSLVVPGQCSVAINTKGTGADKGRVISSTTPGSASQTIGHDSDGDDIDDDGISSSVVPGQCSVAIKTKGTGAEANRVVTSTSSGSSSQTIGHDSDGDDIDDDGISSSVVPGQCSVAIKTKGTGADPNRVVSSAYDDSVTTELTMSDLAGVTFMKVKEKASRTKCSSNLRVTAPGSTTGRDDDCDATSSKTAWTMTGGGSLESVTIEAGSGVDPILHSSGAKLTSGGVWTNASDVALKENFHPVDGERILEQVAALSITEWNYKSEPESVKHIGPTAQDFQAAFGVGSDDKTISTIDPSGIALVAVQELHKENQELKAQLAELRKMYEELARRK